MQNPTETIAKSTLSAAQRAPSRPDRWKRYRARQRNGEMVPAMPGIGAEEVALWPLDCFSIAVCGFGEGRREAHHPNFYPSPIGPRFF